MAHGAVRGLRKGAARACPMGQLSRGDDINGTGSGLHDSLGKTTVEGEGLCGVLVEYRHITAQETKIRHPQPLPEGSARLVDARIYQAGKLLQQPSEEQGPKPDGSVFRANHEIDGIGALNGFAPHRVRP